LILLKSEKVVIKTLTSLNYDIATSAGYKVRTA
jgi:hypothetical protein